MIKHLRRYFLDEAFGRRKSFLQRVALFQGLGDKELGQLCQALHARSYHAGENLFIEDDIGRALFILESGKVQLTRRDSEGVERTIYILGPGAFFGEMAMLEQLPRTATAVAVERSQLYLLYRSKLESLVQYHPRIGVVIMTHLAEMLSARLRLATPNKPPAHGAQ